MQTKYICDIFLLLAFPHLPLPPSPSLGGIDTASNNRGLLTSSLHPTLENFGRAIKYCRRSGYLCCFVVPMSSCPATALKPLTCHLQEDEAGQAAREVEINARN